MENAPGNPKSSNVLAASILGVLLILAALIMAPKGTHPSVMPTGGTATAQSVPPLAQDSVRKQFREQLIAAPTLHTFRKGGKEFTLSDVKVSQVIYERARDEFTISYEWVWQPKNPLSQPWVGYASLDNDGYGHYYGTVVLSPVVGGTGQNTEVTIR